jgi:hypothetical protein
METYNAKYTPNNTPMQVLKVIIRPVPEPHNPFLMAAELLLPLPVSPPMAPPVPVGVWPLGMLFGRIFEPSVNVVGFDTAVAEGTLSFPEGMAWMLLDVALNTVGPREIC